MQCPICRARQWFQKRDLHREVRKRDKIYKKVWGLVGTFQKLDEGKASGVYQVLNYCDKKITEAKEALNEPPVGQ